ncbi:hypothetical protein LIER_23381 [Lithospermum erythrorhizon]|uniref:GCK domain-containing protein n=1 Tax=Lithospermum erythrorhizon TaxID=34254 RepID=A0AAV3QYL0_LITER
MTTPNPTKTHDSPQQIDHAQEPKSPKESKNPKKDPIFIENQENNEVEVKEEEDEEEGECGFCLFMKAGGCRDTFIEWEKCVEESEKNQEDIVDKCHSITKALKECMEANVDHYGPVLRAEKAAEMEAERELEKEIEANVGLDSEQEVEGKGTGLVSETVAVIEAE